MGTIPAPNIAEIGGQIAQAPANQMAEYARIAQLRQNVAMEQQQTQGAQLQNQITQQQLNDQQAMTKAMQQWDGQDINALPDLMRKNGISGPGYLNAQQAIVQRKTQLAALDKDQLSNMQAHHDAALGVIDAAENVPDEQLAQHMSDSVQQLQAQGHLSPQEAQAVLQHSQSMPPDQFRPWLDVYKKGLMAESAQIAQAKTQAETQKNTAQAGEATAKGQQATTEAQTQQWQVVPELGVRVNKVTGETQPVQGASGMMPPQMMEAKYVQLAQKKAAGQPIAPDDAAFMRGYEKYKTLVPTANINLQAGLLNDQAKQMAAQYYQQTGQLPAGMRSPAMSAGILNTAAGAPGAPPPNIAANKQAYAANTQSLNALQKNFDTVTAFENTAGKNLQTFLNQASKVIDSGSPWVNKPLRAIDASALGSEDQAAFNTARATALTEIAKVLSSSNASGVLSDSARGEVSGLIGQDASLKQIVAAANILQRDMENRRQSYQEQIDAVKGRTGGAAQPSANGKFDWNSMPRHQ
jgi:hypothetical protein